MQSCGRWVKQIAALVCVAGLSASLTGCMQSCILKTAHAIPAYRLPQEYRVCTKNQKVPLDLTLLRQESPDEYRIDGGDLLGIFVAGVLPQKLDESPQVLNRPGSLSNEYYPATGNLRSPNLGIPIEVNHKGMIKLPLVGNIDLRGLTIDEAADRVREVYEKKEVLQSGRDRVLVSLMRARVSRVLVLRDEFVGPPQQLSRLAVPFTKSNHGQLIDLPKYENDILHALTESGGLPGLDVHNEVWVLRTRKREARTIEMISHELEEGADHHGVVEDLALQREVIRIPLHLEPGEAPSFTKDDITLKDGDIVYLRPREVEYFYSGGLLSGGKIPLPRGRDIDVLEAIGLANGSVGGPGAITAVFRTGPGNVVPPTRALILRKLPTGQQLSIRVDLNRAARDAKERILIMPEDQLYVFYKPSELYTNLFLNFIGVNVNYLPKI